jgi:uncharacterized protein (TIGR00369 family)
MPEMTAQDIDRFLGEHFPQIGSLSLQVERVESKLVRLRLPHQESQLRPGGTVSGPTMMMLADVTMYVLVLSAVGPRPLAVTTGLTINFLRKPAPLDLIAEGVPLRIGRRLAVGAVTLFSDGEADPVAHATLTYTIPPPGEAA